MLPCLFSLLVYIKDVNFNNLFHIILSFCFRILEIVIVLMELMIANVVSVPLDITTSLKMAVKVCTCIYMYIHVYTGMYMYIHVYICGF